MVKILKPTQENIELAAKYLVAGKNIVFPTETVYGIGANAFDEQAIANIYAIKGRPSFNPLIVHYHNIESAEVDVNFNSLSYKLAERFLPGPLTIVLNKQNNSKISDIASAGLTTLAIRIPSHPITQALLKEANIPIVAPSANRSNFLSPTCVEHVTKSLQEQIEYIIDTGNCMVGLESTIIDLSKETPTILRHGAVPIEEIEEVIGTVAVIKKEANVIAPGMLLKHYAPSKPLRIGYNNPTIDEGLLAFGPYVPKTGFKVIVNLSESANLTEAARNLFSCLHYLDSQKISSIATMPIPNIGIGKAINDKLLRASSK